MKTEGWYVNGVRLDRYAVIDDNNGVTIADRAGWDDVPGLRGGNTVLLGAHGETWRRKRRMPGRKTLNCTINGTDADGWTVPDDHREQRAAYEQTLDEFLRLFADQHAQLLVERVHADGSRREALCEVTSVITPEAVGDSAGLVSVELSIPGSFWRDVDPVTYRLPYDAVAGGTQVLEAFCLAGQTAPCADPVVVVTGPCTSVAVHDTATGSGFTYAHALLLADTLTVDAGAFTALKGVTSVITDLALADQQVLEVISAPSASRGPQLTVAAAGTSAGFSVTLTARRKWLR